ncbi:Uncharacterised protein [Yersinia pseudotuberculosis]|nr:Uncharacterised protein [Yersinia pseudotuberculosis]
MPQIQLAFAAIFGAELDVLFTPFILKAQFVIRRSTQYVAFVVADGDMVAVRRVVQHIGDIRPVRVAVLKCNRHFGACQQRQVQAVAVTRIRAGLTDPQAFVTRLPTVPVKHQIDTVAPVFVDMTISVVHRGAGDPCGQGAGHFWLVDEDRAEAILFGVRDGLKMHFIAAVAAGVAGDAGDYHPFAKLCWHVVAGDVQFLTRCQCRRIGHPGEARLIIEVTFMAQTGIKGPAFTFRLAPFTACGQVVIGVMISFAVGGGITARDVGPGGHIGSGGREL